MHAAEPVLSRTSQHALQPEDLSTFPGFTESGPPTDAYQEATRTGLVDAEEAERAMSRTTSRTAYAETQAEKGYLPKENDAKLVTWLENDPENPRNFHKLRKWVRRFARRAV